MEIYRNIRVAKNTYQKKLPIKMVQWGIGCADRVWGGGGDGAGGECVMRNVDNKCRGGGSVCIVYNIDSTGWGEWVSTT